jgi:hypothetical protein
MPDERRLHIGRFSRPFIPVERQQFCPITRAIFRDCTPLAMDPSYKGGTDYLCTNPAFDPVDIEPGSSPYDCKVPRYGWIVTLVRDRTGEAIGLATPLRDGESSTRVLTDDPEIAGKYGAELVPTACRVVPYDPCCPPSGPGRFTFTITEEDRAGLEDFVAKYFDPSAVAAATRFEQPLPFVDVRGKPVEFATMPVIPAADLEVLRELESMPLAVREAARLLAECRAIPPAPSESKTPALDALIQSGRRIAEVMGRHIAEDIAELTREAPFGVANQAADPPQRSGYKYGGLL